CHSAGWTTTASAFKLNGYNPILIGNIMYGPTVIFNSWPNVFFQKSFNHIIVLRRINHAFRFLGFLLYWLRHFKKRNIALLNKRFYKFSQLHRHKIPVYTFCFSDGYKIGSKKDTFYKWKLKELFCKWR